MTTPTIPPTPVPPIDAAPRAACLQYLDKAVEAARIDRYTVVDDGIAGVVFTLYRGAHRVNVHVGVFDFIALAHLDFDPYMMEGAIQALEMAQPLLGFLPFSPPPPVRNEGAAAWLAYRVPTFTPQVVRDFLDTRVPWAAVFHGPQASGKTILANAFAHLAGSARWTRPSHLDHVETRHTVRRRLHIYDEGGPRATETLLRGLRDVHNTRLYGKVRGARDEYAVIGGYGRGIVTTNASLPDAWFHIPGVRHIRFWGSGYTPLPDFDALVRHLAWMATDAAAGAAEGEVADVL